MPITHNTFVIERSYSASPEKVFAAFADPVKKRRWFAEGEAHDVELFEMDFRVGGIESARYRFKPGTPIQGMTITNVSAYQDVVPNHRVITTSTMSLGEKPMSVMLATVELRRTEKGTDLIFTHQAVFLEAADGPEMRKRGWEKLFDNLAKELAT